MYQRRRCGPCRCQYSARSCTPRTFRRQAGWLVPRAGGSCWSLAMSKSRAHSRVSRNRRDVQCLALDSLKVIVSSTLLVAAFPRGSRQDRASLRRRLGIGCQQIERRKSGCGERARIDARISSFVLALGGFFYLNANAVKLPLFRRAWIPIGMPFR